MGFSIPRRASPNPEAHSKENTVLRASLNPRNVSVIPNAIVSNHFRPEPTAPRPGRITVVVVARLTHLKGADLLVQVIPAVCAARDDVDFLIGGSVCLQV